MTDKDRMRFSKLRLLIWDEISMTSKLVFGRAIKNLRLSGELFCYTPKGEQCRIHMVVPGDFFQLAPVKAKFLFEELLKTGSENATEKPNLFAVDDQIAGHVFWKEFKTVVVLKENMRHMSDPEYGTLLNRLRMGNSEDRDVELLNTRVIENKNAARLDFFWGSRETSCGHQFPIGVHNNAIRNAINWKVLTQFAHQKKIAEPVLCLAVFKQSSRAKKDISEARREIYGLGDERLDHLAPIITVAVGVPVHIFQNIAVTLGIANVTQGTIVGFAFAQSVTFVDIFIRAYRQSFLLTFQTGGMS